MEVWKAASSVGGEERSCLFSPEEPTVPFLKGGKGSDATLDRSRVDCAALARAQARPVLLQRQATLLVSFSRFQSSFRFLVSTDVGN